MTLGLAAFLERIRSQPQNEVLLDRFLLLVADMEDGEKKVTLLLEFVSVIRNEHPKFALQVLRQVYRQIECPWVQRPQELAMQSLQVLHDTMLALGREARAGLIANEMQRLREQPLHDDSIGSSSIQDNIELAREEKFAKKRGNKGEKNRAQIRADHLLQSDSHIDNISSHTMPDEPRTNPFVMPPENDASEMLPQNIPAPKSTPEVDNMTFRDMRKLFRVFDAYIKEEKPDEPKASPPLVVADVPAVPPGVQEPSLLEKLFGTIIQVQDAGDPWTPHIMNTSKNLGWKLRNKDAKRIAAQVRDTDSPLWLVSMWFTIGGKEVRAWFEERASSDELLTAWNACVTHMIEHRMHRRALIFIRVSLDEHMHPNTALAAHKYLTAIWKGMHLRGFSWQPEEGVPLLLEKLTSREQPMCQGLFVAS